MMHPPHHFPQTYNQKQGMPMPVPTAPENYTYSPAATIYPPSGAMYAPPPHGRITRWSTGLCHCMDDPGNCLVTCMCPCITFGQIADIVDKGTCSCVAAGTAYGLLCIACLGCVYSCCYRSRLRAEYDLQEGPAPDFLVHCCCETCALCQEYRELKSKGFDMGIGWDANLDRQRRGATGTPAMGAPAVGQMMR